VSHTEFNNITWASCSPDLLQFIVLKLGRIVVPANDSGSSIEFFGRKSSPASIALVRGQLNVVKGLKPTNQHVGLEEVNI
jgi:hypothetical protein